VKHPFVVALRYAFQSDQRLYMAMEFIQGGDLYTYLYRIGTVTDLQAKVFCAEITLALGHLHAVGVLYRDLKPENVLIDREGTGAPARGQHFIEKFASSSARVRASGACDVVLSGVFRQRDWRLGMQQRRPIWRSAAALDDDRPH
jgi:serine/threonine protein kinase